MNGYNPDKWVVVKITQKDLSPIYKVFACWYGGYTGSDSWRLNSGIAKVSIEDSIFCFEGISGSYYECNKDSYGTNAYGLEVISRMIENAKFNEISIEILPEETNWLEINYAN